MKRVVSLLSACMILGSASFAAAQEANSSEVMFPNFFSSGIGHSSPIPRQRVSYQSN